LVLFVPLGDIIERRRLIVLLLLAVSLSLAIAAGSPTLGILAAASFAIGVTTVVPQLILPFAAGMSSPAVRGRVVGQVVSGLLLGILAGRVVAGAIAHYTGWRTVFAAAAAAMVLLALALRYMLPLAPPASGGLRYGVLIRSLGTIFRAEPVIRDTAVLGALTFASFSAFWTTLAFRLAESPLHYGAATAGAFGLIGLVGAVAAPLAGRMADRRSPRQIVGVGLMVNIVAWLVMFGTGNTIVGLAAGVVLLDAGTQVAQVSNQARVYSLPTAMHGRLNTIYMTCYFIGGAGGSAGATLAWSRWRWVGVCAVALGALLVALVVYFISPGGDTSRGPRQRNPLPAASDADRSATPAAPAPNPG
jgi:predicted MFS family arabinose efflux permease